MREIRDTLAELKIVVTEDDLVNPAGWKVKQTYEQLIELLVGQRLAAREFGPLPLGLLDALVHRELDDGMLQLRDLGLQGLDLGGQTADRRVLLLQQPGLGFSLLGRLRRRRGQRYQKLS